MDRHFGRFSHRIHRCLLTRQKAFSFCRLPSGQDDRLVEKHLQTVRARASRKPMLLLRLSGSFLLRLAERTLLALLFQDPPRNTRRKLSTITLVNCRTSMDAIANYFGANVAFLQVIMLRARLNKPLAAPSYPTFPFAKRIHNFV